MTRSGRSEAVIEGEVLLHSSTVDLVAVSERLAANPALLTRASVVFEGGLYKLVLPGEIESDEELTILTLAEKDVKNTQGLEAKLAKALAAAGYDGDAEEAIKVVATKLVADAYINKKESGGGNDVFSAVGARKFNDGGVIENLQMTAVRPFTVFTAKGWQSAKDVANENWERAVLDAMRANDTTRFEYLGAQAAKALETTGLLGIEASWRELYENSMTLMSGAGNYPSLNTVQGLELFMKKIYAPQVALLLAGPEIASTMGDHQAAMITAELKKQMEIEIATKAADTAEKVQPARARAEGARIGADAKIAEVIEENADVLQEGKRITAKLAAATIASPLLHGAGQIVEAASEAAPAVFRGYAQFLDRWRRQKGVDPKLVGTTSGGIAVGIVVGVVVAFAMTPVAGLVVLVAIPAAAAAGYTAVKGFRTEE